MKIFIMCAAMTFAIATSAFAQTDLATAEAAPIETVAAPLPEATPQTAPNEVQAPPAPALPAGINAPPEGRGQIVFFRPSRFIGAALSFTVRENGQDLGRLSNARYFVHTAEPGIHEYEIGRNDALRLDIEPGTTYFVIQTTQLGVVAGSAVISPSDQSAFEEAAPRMRLWEPRD